MALFGLCCGATWNTVEPIEPIPVITECLGKSDCIMKGNLDGAISCVHHNTRPAATILWFMRDGTHDIPLNSTTNQTLSADLITFSVTLEMAIGEPPLLANMQSLVLPVCKSHIPYSVVQESDSKVLLDLSQNDPFEKQPDPVNAIQNQDLVIECPLHIAAEDSIVMWMAKSLETTNSVYLKYSAYGVVPSVETDEQLSLDKSDDLLISQVGLQHDRLYACVKSTRNTTKSFLQRVEVIVQPTPPTVLVEGCNLFDPCSFHITETKTITCKVNGVHPEVELKIKALSTNLDVINTKVLTYEDEGLFYTSNHGDVNLVDASCQFNETINCQAVGPAVNIFKSDAYVSISSNGVKCPQISAAPHPADKEVQINQGLIICVAIAVILLYILLALIVIGICFPKQNCRRHEGTPRLVKPRQGQIAPKYKPRPQTTTSWYQYLPVLMTVLFGLCCGAAGYTDCLTTQGVLLGSQGVIRCRLFENSTRFYWFDTNNGGDDPALIILENRRVRGTGYTSGEFNIDSDGSLIINSVTVEHERVFHLESLSPSLIRRTKDITVIVYVEPIEPIPVITECLSQPDCIMKENLDRVISCVHHNTRPAATISWFMRDGTHDIPLNSTTNQTLSEDLITFSVTSDMAIGEIPFVVKMPSFVLLVCKSHNPYSVVQESDSKVLLDLSQNDPFEKQSNLPEGPVYAIQNQELVIECPLPIAAEVSIVMWMAKSLEAKNSGYLIYSAYGVVPSVETDEQYSLSKRGDLVISQVGLQHEGLYACVKSTGSTAKSVLQRVEVIVQPTPSKVVVEGCNLFEPCSFHITETKAITCQVNGVHPEVELTIKALTANLAVINTKVSTYEDEGLFYTSIQGDVMLVDANCQVNGTIICQAVGPAANVFKSDAYISISSNGVKCPQISAAPFPADKEGQIKPWIIILLTITLTLLCVFIASKVIGFAKLNCHRNMQAVPVKELDPV